MRLSCLNLSKVIFFSLFSTLFSKMIAMARAMVDYFDAFLATTLYAHKLECPLCRVASHALRAQLFVVVGVLVHYN